MPKGLRSLCLSVCVLALPTIAAAQGATGAYLAGRQAAIAHDFPVAAQYYTRALSRDPKNPALLDSAMIAFLSMGDIDKARPIARQIDLNTQPNQVSNMVLAAALVEDRRFEDLIDRVEQGLGVGPLVDGLVLAWAQIGRGAMSDALEAFDAVAAEPGLKGFALYHKAMALASVGDFEGAEAIYAANADGSMRSTRRGILALAEIYSQLDRNDEAVRVIDTSFTGELSPNLKDLRARLVEGETLDFTHVRSPEDGMAEVFFTIAGALENEAEPDYTLIYARIAQYLRPDHFDALILTAGLLERLERYDLATETYRQVPAGHPGFYEAELGRAEALRRAEKPDAAVEVLEALARSNGDIPIVHSTLGDLKRQQKDFEGAIAAYDNALDRFTGEPRSKWFVHYTRGIAHERLGQWPEAEADFRAALAINPNQPQVLNYLGYSLVEKRTKLDEALNMIERAVAAQPNSGYIVDSLGWVLYRLGRYEEAVVHMERATELMPIDPVVNDHLGDVYWAVGRKLEAEFQWRRALSFVDDESAPEAKPDRIRRKLEVGLDQVLDEEGAEPLKVANDG